MDLVTPVTACALAVEPKLMHALIWQQSGGEPWAVSMQKEALPRVYTSMQEAIRETRSAANGTVRVGLAGLAVAPSKVAAAVFLPCRNAAIAAGQIAKLADRCKTHPRLKADPTFCAVAVYRGSWEQPDVKFATDVSTSTAKGDAPNFDMPRGTSTEIFDTADDQSSETDTPVVDMTSAVADRARGWSSALFPLKSELPKADSEHSGTALSPAPEPPSTRSPGASPSERNSRDRELFVRRSSREPAQ
jgi:hypothetical protein